MAISWTNLSEALSSLRQSTGRRITQTIAGLKASEARSGGGGESGSLQELEKEWKAEMENFDELIRYAENQGDYESLFSHYASARSRAEQIADVYRSRGYSDTSTEVLGWFNKGYDYSSASDKAYEDLLGGLTDSISDLIDSISSASALQEKSLALQEAQYDLDSAQKAVTEAQEGLANAESQRSVKYWNEETDSWDYIADSATVTSARELLEKRQTELRKAENSVTKAENALSKLTLSGQLEAFTASSGTVLGTELAQVIGEALSNYSQSDSAAQNINYYFQNGLQIGRDQAETMTLAQLARLLGNLEVY